MVAEKKTIAHMKDLFTCHTNQSNLNRLVTSSDWNMKEMNRVKIKMINEVEGDGVVVLDDYVIKKYGREIYGTDWHYDHSKGRTVFGWQITDCVLSGKGVYPLLSTVYLKKKSRWVRQKGVFKSKIEIQMDQLTPLVGQLISSTHKIGDKEVRKIVETILPIQACHGGQGLIYNKTQNFSKFDLKEHKVIITVLDIVNRYNDEKDFPRIHQDPYSLPCQ
ncbi:MAG: hypothetical protein DRN33_05645 [Thermoplasmata archaeon]|nr:MAG: hypothetical protein DRN33_05645 [Thermoplasmata archaeon]